MSITRSWPRWPRLTSCAPRSNSSHARPRAAARTAALDHHDRHRGVHQLADHPPVAARRGRPLRRGPEIPSRRADRRVEGRPRHRWHRAVAAAAQHRRAFLRLIEAGWDVTPRGARTGAHHRRGPPRHRAPRRPCTWARCSPAPTWRPVMPPAKLNATASRSGRAAPAPSGGFAAPWNTATRLRGARLLGGHPRTARPPHPALEDGGPTELANLVLVCPFHHRAHHRGLITITGPADDLEVTDTEGRRLSTRSLARPPNSPGPQVAPYRGPTGERADWWWYQPFQPQPPPSDN